MKTLAFISLLITITAFSSVGKIENFEGRAFIKLQNAKGFKKLTKDIEINKGDVIRTYKNSSATVVFNDNSQLKVYEKSIVKIDNNKTDKNNSKSITLFSGKLWAKIRKKVTKKNFFRVNTPTATAGVRGTSFGIAVSSNGSSLVKVREGRVLFDSDLDPKALAHKEKEKVKEEKKSETEIIQPKELNISTSKINREDNSISVDSLTGVKKKSIVLRENSFASFRLSKGINPEANIHPNQFESEEKMPESPEMKKEIITWHISNLKHRVKKANSLIFKVTKISGGIESMKNDKKFTVEQISSSSKKGQKEIEHISEVVESMENSMDAQLHFLESITTGNDEIKEVFEEHKKFRENKNKQFENLK